MQTPQELLATAQQKFSDGFLEEARQIAKGISLNPLWKEFHAQALKIVAESHEGDGDWIQASMIWTLVKVACYIQGDEQGAAEAAYRTASMFAAIGRFSSALTKLREIDPSTASEEISQSAEALKAHIESWMRSEFYSSCEPD
jgi:hypothetical protein